MTNHHYSYVHHITKLSVRYVRLHSFLRLLDNSFLRLLDIIFFVIVVMKIIIYLKF